MARPQSQAEFCALRGQTNADRNTLLERTAGQLVTATEALAAELRDYRAEVFTDLKVFMSVIVTTATLKMATFDPAAISLDDGMLGGAEFTEVPYLRLRKQLSTRLTAFGTADYARDDDPAASKEHTVFIVRANALVDFLSSFGIDLNPL